MRIANLQALRAVAALAVVVFHFGLLPPTSLPFRVGASGVDLFFVLSGFIIAHSSARSPRHFLAHRLIRVIPAYWIATVVAALFTLQSLDLRSGFDWLVQSLFYLSGPGGRPVLIFVAWTLLYELAFYLLYWTALRIDRRRAPLITLVALSALGVVNLPGLGPRPLLFEFVIGIAVYLLTVRSKAVGSAGAAIGLATAGVGFTLLLVLPELTGYNPDDYQSIGRVLTWGLPAGIIILALVIAERHGLAVRNRLVLQLGAASYATYLLHPIVIGQLLQLSRIPLIPTWTVCLAAAAMTAALALAFHFAIEKPLLRWARALIRDPLPVKQRV